MRTLLQTAKLQIKDGRLTVIRDEPFDFDLPDLTEEILKNMVDQTVAQTKHPEAQAAAVKQLQALEHKNTEVARRLLGL